MIFATRFAPSPTGRLHLGHAYSALLAHDAARAANGRFLLRIEDTDRTRSRQEFEHAILDDLTWLGITWDEPPRRQSQHMAEYEAGLQKLIDAGLCYRCFKTRQQVLTSIAHAPHGPEQPYFGAPLPPAEENARLAAGEPFSWRLSAARAQHAIGETTLTYEDQHGVHPVDPLRLGDAVIGRKDFPASYHLACVLDDALQGITYVIRGEDIRDSVHLHVMLQRLFDLPTPRYVHHRLILDANGKRLAKRDGAEGLASLRAAGVTPAEIRARVGL